MLLERHKEELLPRDFHAHGHGWLGLPLARSLSLRSDISAVLFPGHISESLHASLVLWHHG